ncbi:sulfite exporter TauE/SafE family protein [Spirosoma harenae]
MSPWLATAFLTGLISSLHCVGMCGPLVAALPVGRLPRGKRWQAIALYHTGRMAIYSGLGALAGTMSFGLQLLNWQRPLAIGGGIFLLLSFAGRRRLPSRFRWPWLSNQVTTLFRKTLNQPNWIGFAGLGSLNGLLPCGFTYLALAGTLSTTTPLAGVAYMLLFGLGTLPALLGVNLITDWLTAIGRQRLNRFLSMATIAVALLLIWRGLAQYQLPIAPADVIPLCRGFLPH